MKKRIRFFDVLRVVSFACIIYYHMVVQMHLDGFWSIEEVSPLYENSNMHLATLAVAVFFMLSGAALMNSTKDEERLSLQQFYKKRFLRLLIPFYVTVAVYAVVMAFVHHGRFWYMFPGGIPKWRLIFTLLGVDEWVNMHGYPTFSTGIGEWYLGAIIILYLLFPVLHHLVRKAPGLTLAAATCIYLVLVFIRNPFPVDPQLNLLLKGYEFLLGMYLGLYWRKITWPWQLAGLAVMLAFFFAPVKFPIPTALKITAAALACFIGFSALERLPGRFAMNGIRKIAGISYEMFLVHHMVIYRVLAVYSPRMGNNWSLVWIFGSEILLTIVFGLLVKFISRRVIRCIIDGVLH